MGSCVWKVLISRHASCFGTTFLLVSFTFPGINPQFTIPFLFCFIIIDLWALYVIETNQVLESSSSFYRNELIIMEGSP